jgi:benzoyl-CoA 2,3-dioxygenase component B
VLRPGPDGAVRSEDVPALSALNMRLRDDYVNDCQKGIDRWNRVIANSGIDFTIRLPHVGFHRQIGEFRTAHYDVEGNPLGEDEWNRRRHEMLPNSDDQAFIEDLMKVSVREPGKFAGWIAPPRVGIDNRPGDFEYVKIV